MMSTGNAVPADAASQQQQQQQQVAEQHRVGDSLRITTSQEAQWREAGYCIVDGFDVFHARSEAIFDRQSASGDFGSKDGAFEFPCGLLSIDDIPIRLQDVAQQLLRTPRAVLSQADVWIKEPKRGDGSGGAPSADAEMSNDNQRMHCDFGNNTLLPSPDWYQPNGLAAIVYLDGPESCRGGATAVVARRGANDDAFLPHNMMLQPGYGGRPYVNNRNAAEKWFELHRPDEHRFRQRLYEREVKCAPQIGRVLLYRLDIWHRGTPLLHGRRRVVNLVFQHPSDPGHCGRWNPGFWKNSYWFVGGRYAPPDALFVRMSPKQRQILGLPDVDDCYWTQERLRLLTLRFPGFDPSPYLSAMRCKQPPAAVAQVQRSQSPAQQTNRRKISKVVGIPAASHL